MKTPLLTRIKYLFARDKFDFMFEELTDDEKKLKNMDAWELAAVIDNASNNTDSNKHRIVAEHLLNVRLAKISAFPSYMSIIGGLLCVFLGAFLNSALEKEKIPIECVCECQDRKQPYWQIPGQIPPIEPVYQSDVQKSESDTK